MSQSFENLSKIKVSTLSANQSYSFSLSLSAAESKAICGELGLLALRKASLAGEIVPSGAADWALSAKLGATVVQPCVVSLEPVTTRIDDDVERLFLEYMPDDAHDEDEEIEMSENENIEPLTSEISLINVFREALALALPAYPRQDDSVNFFGSQHKTHDR